MILQNLNKTLHFKAKKGNTFHDFLISRESGPPKTLKNDKEYVCFALMRFPVSTGPKPCSGLSFLGTFWGSDSPEIAKSPKRLPFKAKKVTLREGFSGFQRILVKKGAGPF